MTGKIPRKDTEGKKIQKIFQERGGMFSGVKRGYRNWLRIKHQFAREGGDHSSINAVLCKRIHMNCYQSQTST